MCLSVTESLDTAVKYVRVYNTLQHVVAMTRSTIRDPDSITALDKLQKLLEGKGDEDDHPHSECIKSR